MLNSVGLDCLDFVLRKRKAESTSKKKGHSIPILNKMLRVSNAIYSQNIVEEPYTTTSFIIDDKT